MATYRISITDDEIVAVLHALEAYQEADDEEGEALTSFGDKIGELGI